MVQRVSISQVTFREFKGLQNFTLNLQRMTILVGPNNCGKSTILDAFRSLETGIKRARSKRAERVPGPDGTTWGYALGENSLPMSTENVHTDYRDVDSTVTFRLSNGNSLTLYFPVSGGCYMMARALGGAADTPGRFRKAFPVSIGVIPVLGPVEHRERLLTIETVRAGLATHRASRHFRNYWHHYPEGFDEFEGLVRKTWSGMEIEKPELKYSEDGPVVAMFGVEKRIPRELYWAGFGFQIWCQLLTHISRTTKDTLLVVDEPEIYLHPDVQRQLLGIMREAGPDILMATHSGEIMSEADPSEIVVVDKGRRTAQRLRDIEAVQGALDAIGSMQNVTLTQLARNRRILFMEGLPDFRLMRRFARRAGFPELAGGLDLTPAESDGFGNWRRVQALAWGMKKTLGGALHLGAVFDHDYRPEEETKGILRTLRKDLDFAVIHDTKEMENYLLVPVVLQRALERAVTDRAARIGDVTPSIDSVNGILESITEGWRPHVQAQMIEKRVEHFVSTGRDRATITAEAIRLFDQKWGSLESRLKMVPGKQTLKELRSKIQDKYSVTLTDARIVDSFHKDEMPFGILRLLSALEQFRTVESDSNTWTPSGTSSGT